MRLEDLTPQRVFGGIFGIVRRTLTGSVRVQYCNSTPSRWGVFIATLFAHILVPLVACLGIVIYFQGDVDYLKAAAVIGTLLGFLCIYKNAKWLTETFVVVVANGEHWVLGNKWPMRRAQTPEEEVATGYHIPLYTSREFTPGWHIKFPWENINDDWKVKMSEELIIVPKADPTTGKSTVFYTGSDAEGIRKTLTLSWRIAVKPIFGMGLLTRYVLVPKGNIDAEVSSDVLRILKMAVGRLTPDAFEARATDWQGPIADELKNMYGGPNVIVDVERKNGIYTGTPRIIDYALDEKAQAILDFKLQIRELAKAAEQIHRESNGRISEDNAFSQALLLLAPNVRELIIRGGGASLGRNFDFAMGGGGQGGNQGNRGGGRRNRGNRGN